MTVYGSLGGSTTFIKFDSVKMLFNWSESINRVSENFTVTLFASITFFNSLNPFIAVSTF